jgi:hypothetical protein
MASGWSCRCWKQQVPPLLLFAQPLRPLPLSLLLLLLVMLLLLGCPWGRITTK